MSSRSTVLIVDDERDMCALFERYLQDAYRVLTATSGTEALDLIDETVDVALIDRRMPGMSGDELVDRIRERGLDVPVALVTAVDPDFNVVSRGFDAYVLKPVSQEGLNELVESLLELREYNDLVRELFEIVSKVALLEEQYGRSELRENEEYRDLRDRLEEVKAASDEIIDDLVERHTIESILSKLD